MFGNILNVARGALFANQAAIQTASHNISNAQTEGFSRQRVDLVAAPATRVAEGYLGNGVRMQEVVRLRDVLLDRTYRRETGNSEFFDTRARLMGQVEEIFGELSEDGFSEAMEDLWSSWADLANDPTNGSVRGLVKENAHQVVFALRNFSARLDLQASDITARIERGVVDVNGIARQLADVNRQIGQAEAAGSPAPDLRDQRDLLLDNLSGLANTQVIERSDGSVGVYLGTLTLVDGTQSHQVAIDPVTQDLYLGTTKLRDLGGSLGGLLSVRDTDLVNVKQRLDAFARKLVEETNAIHLPGTGVPFFDPAFVTAGTLALDAAITADPSLIGVVPGKQTDNTVSLQITALRDQPISFPIGGSARTFAAFYADLTSDVGVNVRAAEQSQQVYATMASQVEARRASTSGVSTDEELMSMMQHQQAYAAATKVISTVDEMMKQLLAM